MRSDAVLSDDGVYRYLLSRTWDEGTERLGFVMLNPSTADAELDDPTIRRCMSFARRQSFGGIVVVNLFAFRATSPKDMLAAADPVGPENDDWLVEVARGRTMVAAWGATPTQGRAAIVAEMLTSSARTLQALGTTSAGHPRHPLYVKGDQPLLDWPARG